jgi:hypothetical protein
MAAGPANQRIRIGLPRFLTIDANKLLNKGSRERGNKLFYSVDY